MRTAAAWQKCRPPLPVPADIKPFAKQPRLAAASLGRVRRIVDANDEFRARLASAVVPELVDELGIAWLRREPGWEERVGELVERRAKEAAERDSERLVASEQRRRVAAEESATRTRAELVALAEKFVEREQEFREFRHREQTAMAELEALRRTVSELKQEARHARDREGAARSLLERVEAERDDAIGRATTAAAQRDALLANRADLPDGSQGAAHIARLRQLADVASTLVDGLTAMVSTGPSPRQAVDVPRTAAKDPRKTAEYLLKAPGMVVFVDGYNVAKLGWPELSLEQQRAKLLDSVDGLARRFGTEFVVVLDGADVVGAHADRRRLARVRYSPAGVTADDIIRDEVGRLDTRRPVVVVTNDREVRRDVIAAGANVLTSDSLVDLALR